MNVSAKDLGTGKQQQITISGSTALNDDEVERMVKDAEAHAEEDAKRKEEIEVRNNADALVNATEQTLQEVGDKAPADVKSAAEEAIAEAKQALEGSDMDAIKAATEKMQQAGYKLAEVVYSTQGPAPAALDSVNRKYSFFSYRLLSPSRGLSAPPRRGCECCKVYLITFSAICHLPPCRRGGHSLTQPGQQGLRFVLGPIPSRRELWV